MDSRKILAHIVGRINILSRCYSADILKEPRLYYELTGARLIPSLKKGILVERNNRERYFPTRAFVFAPEITRYLARMSHRDKGFAKRLTSLQLTPDDIETMFRTLTFQRIRLYMKGRRIFDADNGGH